MSQLCKSAMYGLSSIRGNFTVAKAKLFQNQLYSKDIKDLDKTGKDLNHNNTAYNTKEGEIYRPAGSGEISFTHYFYILFKMIIHVRCII